METKHGAGVCLVFMLLVNLGGWVVLRQEPAPVVVTPPAPSCTPSPTPVPSASSKPPVPRIVHVEPHRRIDVRESAVFSPERPHGPPDWLAPHLRRETGERLATREPIGEEECGNLVLFSHNPPAGGVVLLWPENTAFRELLRSTDMVGVLLYDAAESFVGRVIAERPVAKRPGLPDLFDLEVELQCGVAEGRELYRSVTEEAFPVFVAEFHYGFSVVHQPDDDHDNLERSILDLHISIQRRKAPQQHITHVVAPFDEGQELGETIVLSIRAAFEAAWAAGVRVKVVAVADEEEAVRLRYPLEEPSVLFRCDCGEGDDMPRMFMSHALDTAWREGNSEYVLVTSRNVALAENAYVDLWEHHSDGSATVLGHKVPRGGLLESVSDGSMYLPFSWAKQLDVRGQGACSVPVQLSQLGVTKRRPLGITTLRGEAPAPLHGEMEELYCESQTGPAWNTDLHANGRRAVFFAEQHLMESRRPLNGVALTEAVPEKFHRLIRIKEWEAGKGERTMIAAEALNKSKFPTTVNRLVAVLSSTPEEGAVLLEIVLNLTGVGMVVAAPENEEGKKETVRQALGQPTFASFSSRFDTVVRPAAQLWKETGARHMVEPSHLFFAMADVLSSAFGKSPYHLQVVRVERGIAASVEALLACQVQRQGPFEGVRFEADLLCYNSLPLITNPAQLAIALVPEDDERFEDLYGWMGGVVGFVFNAIASAEAFEASVVQDNGISVSTVWYDDLLNDSEAVRVLVNDLFSVRFYSPLEPGHPPRRPPPTGMLREELQNQVARFVKAYQDHGLWLPTVPAMDLEMQQIVADPERFFRDPPPMVTSTEYDEVVGR